jgi:proline iminopeptidase
MNPQVAVLHLSWLDILIRIITISFLLINEVSLSILQYYCCDYIIANVSLFNLYEGCGDSLPFAELRENSTYESIKDFEKLRVLLNISKWQVFGGSWGSTLSLAYAMEHPDRVTELVLRSIILIKFNYFETFHIYFLSFQGNISS